MKENQIVRRLRSYENETGPITLRGLRDDAAWEIVTWRAIAFTAILVPGLLALLHATGVLQLPICGN
jgi:hypothetical protein